MMTCGFEASTIDGSWWLTVPKEHEDDLITSCERDVWDSSKNDEARCFWHAETEQKSSAEIAEHLKETEQNIDFAYLPKIKFNNIDFSGEVFRFSNFSGADFSESTIKYADFDYCKFTGANLSGLEIRNVNFPHCDFTGASLDRLTCARVNFSCADFSEATLVQSQFQTRVSIADAKLDTAVMRGLVVERDTIVDFESQFEQRNLDQAIREYERLEQVAETSSLSDIRDEMYIKRKHAKRKSYDFLSWDRFLAGLSRWVLLYGERPSRTVIWSLITIIAYIPLIACAGGISGDSQTVRLTATNATTYGYFSAVTFSTVGYGDYRPATDLSALIAASESLLGAVMIALIVFALGRRATK